MATAGILVVIAACATACGRIEFDSVVDAGPLTYREQVLADHPLGYFRLSDTDMVAHDETGTANGTYLGNCNHVLPGALAADADGAAVFDGADPCSVSLGDRFAFPTNSAFSLEMWINIRDRSGGGYVLMRESRNADESMPFEGYGVIANFTSIYGERVVATDTQPAGFVPLPMRWTHVVYAYDGAEQLLYLDGQLAASSADTRPMAAYTASFTIGSLESLFAATDGDIDEVAIYDHALAPERVMTHFSVGTNGP